MLEYSVLWISSFSLLESAILQSSRRFLSYAGLLTSSPPLTLPTDYRRFDINSKFLRNLIGGFAYPLTRSSTFESLYV